MSLLNNFLITITFFIIYLDFITLILFNIIFKFIFILLSLFYRSIIISFTSLYLISIRYDCMRDDNQKNEEFIITQFYNLKTLSFIISYFLRSFILARIFKRVFKLLFSILTCFNALLRFKSYYIQRLIIVRSISIHFFPFLIISSLLSIIIQISLISLITALSTSISNILSVQRDSVRCSLISSVIFSRLNIIQN